MNKKKLLVGTSKGLVVFHKVKQQWIILVTHFLGMPVSLVYVDEWSGRWWIGVSHHHWGQKLHFTDDEGLTWKSVLTPKFSSDAELASGKRATLKKIWVLQNGGEKYPNRLWLGTEPGALFLSEDQGQHFEVVESLWNHPSRLNKQQWFGTGRSEPFIHSIIVNPANNDHVYIAVSCAGIFETLDSGKNWQVRNKGLIAAYLPNPHVEIGHDPHRILACKSHPEVLWQQNHCGIFRSIDAGLNWKDVSDVANGVHYGFALAIDPQNAERAWVIPAISDELRIPKDQALRVYRTEDGGISWTSVSKGLPQANCFDIVFRHALAIQGQILAFGTTTGNVYLSESGGDVWKCLSTNLARVNYVSFV